METEAAYLELPNEDDMLHLGIIRRSGRYPWGSGEDPYQRSIGFKGEYEKLRKQGLTKLQIAEGLGLLVDEGPNKGKPSRTKLDAAIAISTEEIAGANQSRARYLKEDRQMSTSAVARQMGVNESTVRGWLKASEQIREDSIKATREKLKEEVANKEFLDVGKGNHLYMGVPEVKFKTALAALHDEGYRLHTIKVPQLGTGKLTTYKVLTKEGVEWPEVRAAVLAGNLRTIAAQSDDGGLHFRTPKKDPVSIDSKRIDVRWAEDGGAKMDGVIELRRGVEDLSLGQSRYAQVRVAVDGTHYLKGMAMHADDLPPGVDVRFNTNKARSSSKLDAMKPLKTTDGKIDPDSPFGATTRQKVYLDKNGKERTSALNIVNEEGNWDDWSKALSSQMLSKQPLKLAEDQLGKAQSKKEKTLSEIQSLTNPVVRQKMLKDFADDADAAAVHLKAAAMPRQATRVILPISSIRPNEIYAPDFKPGEKVVLIRHPHGGPFEIPELTVNNRNPQARRILGNARDAVGIHHSVAEQLSGADFDGDTVLVIPNGSRKIKTRPPLAKLKDFDPKAAYPETPGMKVMTKKATQREMGRISNLITDMSIHGANDDELTRAVRHSMVVIDAEKHKLNYKLSELDNDIKQLKAKYQGGATRGASTIISRAGSEKKIPEVKQPSGIRGVNPKTGEKILVPTGRTYQRPIKDKNGNPTGKFETVPRMTKGTAMEFTKDARTLMSEGGGTPMEKIYAAHANIMKSLANRARKEGVSIKMPTQSKMAKASYAKEVKSLNEKLKIAQRNAPLERRAQIIGNAMAKAKIDAHPEYDKDDIKTVKYKSLEEARHITGANKIKIGSDQSPITSREWAAIQAGAISSSMLKEILTHADMNRVQDLATPRARTSLTPGQLARARQMMQAGNRSMTEIAEELGIPRSTLKDNLASD